MEENSERILNPNIFLKCYKIIDHCKEYDDTDTDECNLCDNGYYLDSSERVCIKGQEPFCSDFQSDEEICTNYYNIF